MDNDLKQVDKTLGKPPICFISMSNHHHSIGHILATCTILCLLSSQICKTNNFINGFYDVICPWDGCLIQPSLYLIRILQLSIWLCTLLCSLIRNWDHQTVLVRIRNRYIACSYVVHMGLQTLIAFVFIRVAHNKMCHCQLWLYAFLVLISYINIQILTVIDTWAPCNQGLYKAYLRKRWTKRLMISSYVIWKPLLKTPSLKIHTTYWLSDIKVA